MASGEVLKVDVAQQKALLSKVDRLLESARSGMDNLSRTYVEIGVALDAVENAKAWLLVARSYDSYIKDHCEPKFGKSRTQLYNYRSVAKNLLPHMPAEKLLEIGISKAQPLAQYVRRSGGKLPENLVESAIDPQVGVEEFKAAVAESQHEKPEKGKWYEIPGFYVTADEKIELDYGLELAETIEPLPADAPVWLARKVAVQRLVMEFISTYGKKDE